MITHRLALDDAPRGYKTFRDKKDDCIKVVLKPDGNGGFRQHGHLGHSHSAWRKRTHALMRDSGRDNLRRLAGPAAVLLAGAALAVPPHWRGRSGAGRPSSSATGWR